MLGIFYENYLCFKCILMFDIWIGWFLCKDYIVFDFYEL